MPALHIGDLARRSGVARSTIRYYERIGLLAACARTAAGYRVYAASALVELGFVRRAQALGFTLEDIRELLRLHRAGRSPYARLVAVAQQRLRSVEQELESLGAFRTYLAEQIAGWTACHPRGAFDGPCALIECHEATCAPAAALLPNALNASAASLRPRGKIPDRRARPQRRGK
ncbi:MAG: MerR family transcriptional regulator [Gemmatimonadaceae bacterium]